VSIADALPLRLKWYAGRGLAIGNGAMMTLSCPPYLGFDFVEIDYAPGLCELVRSRACEPVRDMWTDEAAACARFLRALECGPDEVGE
jgi:hypothetical protein